MVSTDKMVQSRHRLIQFILLCLVWQLGTVSLGWGQYSSIRFQQEDAGKILLALINVTVHKVGKKLDKGYKCPLYCGVNHKHIYWKEDEEKITNEGDIQTIAELHRAVRAPGKE